MARHPHLPARSLRALLPVPALLVSALLICSAATAGTRHAAVVELRILPPSIELTGALDRQAVVIQAELNDGTTLDVTGQAFLALQDGQHARLEGTLLRPRGNGDSELFVDYAGTTATAAVHVTDLARQPAVSFRLDVLPALTRAGCNSGACHGSSRGQDGFRLSLFGFDPTGDYQRITREQVGRRIDLAHPARSLLLDKGLGNVPHTGGRRFAQTDAACATLLEWLRQGAADDAADIARPIGLELLPRLSVLRSGGETQQMVVMARYSDGSDRDVTALSAFLSSDAGVARVSEDGVTQSDRRGEAQITARFATFVVGANVMVLPASAVQAEFPVAPGNWVDEPIFDKLRRLRIAPSPLCDDATFVRRAYIDVIGSLPRPVEVDAFTAATRADKRALLIDELLQRQEFTELWVMKWAELLQIRTDENRKVSYKAMLRYADWLADRIARNVRIDRIVHDLIASSGGTFQNPATNFYQVEQDPLKLAENTAQVMLGMRIQCAQCHNHPFDRWTMDDYYGFAAFFAQIGGKEAQDPREAIIFDARSGATQHPVSKAEVAPKFLGGAVPDLAGRDRREVLADWLTAPDNPYFARNLVNLVWAHFFGRGLVEPVDDARVTNPPSHPELQDELARRFVASGYDFRQLIRELCTSTTYQLASVGEAGNHDDTRNFSHVLPRRMRAEVLLDAIGAVTETTNKFRGLPDGARAVQIADGSISNYFLDTFGRASRETVCSCEVKVDPNLSQALHLLNGDTTQQRIVNGGVVARQLTAGRSPQQIVDDLYLRCFARRPGAAERDRIDAALAAEPGQEREILEDLFWALLNSREFLFNH